jgi:RNA polymerase sigma-70 factor (ECF subfamily)
MPTAFEPTDLEHDALLASLGDLAARERISRAVVPLISRQLQRFRLTPDDQRDVSQNALLRVHQRLGDFRGEARFTTWLFRLTTNEALMYLRAERRRRARLSDEETDVEMLVAPESESSPHEPGFDGTVVRRVLSGLPVAYREMLHAHYDEDRALAEIARERRTTESSVRSSLQRARRMLRGRLAHAGVSSVAHATAR